MQVKIVSKTAIDNTYLTELMKSATEVDAKFLSTIQEAEALMVYIARVSSPNQKAAEYSKLLKYCMNHGHWSVFEQVSATFEIETNRAISAQILRHKSFTFQEFCMSGDTLVYFDMPSGIKKGKAALYKISLKELYRKWNNCDALGVPLKNRVKTMNVRILDTKTNLISHSNIKEVFQTGVKDVFEITLQNGKKIKSTKEHKVWTKKGFLSLHEAFGLDLIGNTAVISEKGEIGCNGVDAYKDLKWMTEAKKRAIENKTGLQGIADEANMSYFTIRKWLKKLNLSFTKKEVASYTPSWNINKTGYKVKPRSREQKDAMIAITPRGKNHHAYKGGGSSERKAVAAFFNTYRTEIFQKFDYTCQMCNEKFAAKKGKIDLHHIKHVSTNPESALDITNIIPVHRSCHMTYHGKLMSENKQKRGSKSSKTVWWSKIKEVKYIGKEMTYDLEIESENHNYVADGVIVHNSQRYQKVEDMDIEIYEARRQDSKNRQNSINDLSEADKDFFEDAQREVAELAFRRYNQALDRKIAKESARALLPMNTKTKMYVTGTLRSWIHYLQVRCAAGTQKEHRDIALAIKEILKLHFPITVEAMDSSAE